MDLGLRERAYLVTGGTRGLGFATAEALAADGARVLVASRSREHVDDAVARLGENARGAVADLAEPDAAARLCDEAERAFGRLDGALVSVGGPPAGGALDNTEEQWRAAYETVVLGAARVVREVAARLGEGGAIGLVLSSSVKQPVPGISLSNLLRPGLAMWVKHLADELGPRGVRVVSLVPGLVKTERITELFGEDTSAQEHAVPLRRLGRAEEFGRVAAFALSPAASYMTGCAIPVDGGSIRGL